VIVKVESNNFIAKLKSMFSTC